ncbi:hypothetical protein HYW60_02830 [Candidatus Kaiserbacteria bacterium]|nr:hypothetical protein [Candidatus Kaiserbacteria bacterium]
MAEATSLLRDELHNARQAKAGVLEAELRERLAAGADDAELEQVIERHNFAPLNGGVTLSVSQFYVAVISEEGYVEEIEFDLPV